MNYIIHNANHEDWLKNRAEGIGSSEVATLLGVNQYETPYQLWLKKTGRVRTEEKETFLMKAGHYLEDAISRFCADEVGLDIVKSSASEFIVVNSDKPFLRVSPDRYAYPNGEKHTRENKCIIECKSTQHTIDPDDIPDYWFVQVMYQLGVSEVNRAYISWLTQGREFGQKLISFDKDFYRYIAEIVERFWVDNILGGAEPELSNLTDVLIKYPKHTPDKEVIASDDLIQLCAELKDKNTSIKRLEAERDMMIEKIKFSMKDAESLVVPFSNDNPKRVLATFKASKDSTAFDEDAFKKANPDLYSQYLRKKSGNRRFSIK